MLVAADIGLDSCQCHRAIDCKLNDSIIDSDRSNVKTGLTCSYISG